MPDGQDTSGRLSGWVKRLFGKTPPAKSPGENTEYLRTRFKERYHHFKLLLNANNKALDIMTEMEEALKGTSPFGMNFIRSRCTRISTSVFQIVDHLNKLAPRKYQALYDGFHDIERSIRTPLDHAPPPKEGPLTVPIDELTRESVDHVGSKVATLGEIKNRLRFRVPEGFAVTAEAYGRFIEANDLQGEIDRRIQSASTDNLDQLYSLSADLQQLVARSPLPEEIKEAIREHYRVLREREGRPPTVAMRSSALGEDLYRTSFAGQYRSELNVSEENILQAYTEIVASKYSLPAMTYRLNRGIRDEDVAMCVGCMSMVDARAGGVMYTRDPVDIQDDAVIINAVWGLPKSVVDGSTPTDLYIVSRGPPLRIRRREIGSKAHQFKCYPEEGICRFELNEKEALENSLTQAQAIELASMAEAIEEHFGSPQDVEWALTEAGDLILLQCRPLQQGRQGQETPVSEDELGTVLLNGGVRASPGAAAGAIFKVEKDVDVLRFPQGGVLLTRQALPRWAPLLSRSSAVLTEQGSVAGHLANVAREFGVPALFALPEATERLDNDQEVTVDADRLKVYQGRIESLLETRRPPKNLMEGSPVFETLRQVTRYIVPLNLLDPDSPDFRPKNCRTFHDITRYCHEKAVNEMFLFGKQHHFPERSSKQLQAEDPMQWWVLNLDDGFKEEVEGKYISLDNVVSIPMLALWRGITAVPWEGPPAINGRGFMSVMFQATRNPNLVPGARSRYADRNYFMISRNYCSLTSRLGFHFSIVESLVSDRARENYISFQYKGGAADIRRRLGRINFIKEILEKYAFRVEMREDHLIARIENYERPFMEKRLEILGYLTIHTRQLDMIMSDNTEANRYRQKMDKDIEALLSDR